MTPAQTRQAIQPVLSIWREAGRENQERQLVFGDHFAPHRVVGYMAHGRSVKDGYLGFVDLAGLGPPDAATHFVSSRATHLYPVPDIKSPPLFGLTFGSRLTIKRTIGTFLETSEGRFIPASHARPVKSKMDDPAAVAEMFLGTPYLWGGNSCWGIDCSGLVQAALLACGTGCPADSDPQQKTVGAVLPEGAGPARGDLLFWKGHVAMVLDDNHLIHATAFHMAVVIEDINVVTGRIYDMGHGPVLARRRP